LHDAHFSSPKSRRNVTDLLTAEQEKIMILNRRKFIKRILVVLASIEALFLIKGSVNKVNTSTKKVNLFKAGKVEEFEKGKLYSFLTGQFFLKRFEDGGFMALSIKCTHLGCVVNIDSKTGGFNCPCHASQFDKLGEVTSAPATRPLDFFPIEIKGGEIYVDTRKAIQRSSFSKSQITYA
jgi:Rieske Fe-S protein